MRRSTTPHTAHCCEVCLASITTIGPLRYGPPCTRGTGAAGRTRSCRVRCAVRWPAVPAAGSPSTPRRRSRPGVAPATMLLLIRWFTSVTNRASFSERAFSLRFADLVPLCCNPVRTVRFFFRHAVTAPPDQFSPVLVVARFTMPMSTPTTAVGVMGSVSGTSTRACSHQDPSRRRTRSVSPHRCSARARTSSGRPM